jgi:hypothetical protein
MPIVTVAGVIGKEIVEVADDQGVRQGPA